MRWQPSLQIISHYESEPLYINALINSITKKISELKWKPDIILASYHGIPKKYFDNGDPYHCYCQKTSRLLSEKFTQIPIITTFQSRFGPQEWLTPYTDKTLEELPAKGIKKIHIISPGFSSDCLETLEELGVENKDNFLKAGGNEYYYIKCLNDNSNHLKMLSDLILNHIQGWPEHKN